MNHEIKSNTGKDTSAGFITQHVGGCVSYQAGSDNSKDSHLEESGGHKLSESLRSSNFEGMGARQYQPDSHRDLGFVARSSKGYHHSHKSEIQDDSVVTVGGIQAPAKSLYNAGLLTKDSEGHYQIVGQEQLGQKKTSLSDSEEQLQSPNSNELEIESEEDSQEDEDQQLDDTQFFSDDSQEAMSALYDGLGSNLENQLGKMCVASVGGLEGKEQSTLKDFSSSLKTEPQNASAMAQEAIDGLVNQTLSNIGLERTPELEAKFWSLDKQERASIATRLVNRDKTVFKDLKIKLK